MQLIPPSKGLLVKIQNPSLCDGCAPRAGGSGAIGYRGTPPARPRVRLRGRARVPSTNGQITDLSHTLVALVRSSLGGTASVSDPDRVVVFDDIADLLVPVPPVHHVALHRLLLSLFSVPLNLAAPESQTSTDWAAVDTTCLPAVRPAFAWASLLERPVVAPPAMPLDADTVFPQPKAHGPLHGIPGARRSDDGTVLLWGTLAADGEQDGSQGNLTADQVEFVRYVRNSLV